ALLRRPAIRRQALLQERVGLRAPPGLEVKRRQIRFYTRTRQRGTDPLSTEGGEGLLEKLLRAQRVAGDQLRDRAVGGDRVVPGKQGHPAAGLPPGVFVPTLLQEEQYQEVVSLAQVGLGLETSLQPALGPAEIAKRRVATGDAGRSNGVIGVQI